MGLIEPGSESLRTLAAGTLDPMFRLMLETRAKLAPRASRSIQQADLIAVAFFEEGDEVAMRAGALDNVMKRIEEADALLSGVRVPGYLNKVPCELRNVVACALANGVWQSRGPGIRTLPLRAPRSRIEENGGSVLLFESSAGARVPRHKHLGEEYLLVLKGALSEDEEAPSPAGSLIFNGPGSSHAPRAAQGTGCAALVISTGGLEVLPTGSNRDTASA